MGPIYRLKGKFCRSLSIKNTFRYLRNATTSPYSPGRRNIAARRAGSAALSLDWRYQLSDKGLARVVVLGVVFAVLPVLTVEAGQSRADFAPHRALYSMSLGSTSTDSGITDVEGRMAFEWREDCDGWVVEQRYAMRYFGASNAVREVDTTFTTWESKDGKRYRFFVTNKPGMGSPPKIEGFASHPGASGTGMARFKVPDGSEFELPGTSLFPSAHTFAMIDAALAGGKFFAAPMFDGSEVEGPTSVSAVMGLERIDADAADALLKGRHWPMRLAFFAADSKGSEPTYEMSATMHSNGVASGMVLDYGDFTVKVELKTLEALPKPAC